LMCQHQVPLITRKLTRLESGVNFPPAEVIMSRPLTVQDTPEY
jgi:hypothetical protein